MTQCYHHKYDHQLTTVAMETAFMFRQNNTITGLDCPWEFQKCESPRFEDNRHMKVVRLSSPRTGCLYPIANIPGTNFCCGPGSSVGIATDYGLDGRDRIPVGTRLSIRPDRPWSTSSLLYSGYRVFPRGKVQPGRAADHSPHSSAAVMEQ